MLGGGRSREADWREGNKYKLGGGGMSDDGIRHKSRLCVCVSKGGRGEALLPRQAGSEAEVDGQAIQPPFTFNERAPRLLLARSLACRERRCFMRRWDSKHFVRK